MSIRKLNGNKDDERGFELVYLKGYKDIRETPHCKKHGAMNCLKTSKGDLLWRCYTEYGYAKLKEGQTKRKPIYRTCNACCIEEMPSLSGNTKGG